MQNVLLFVIAIAALSHAAIFARLSNAPPEVVGFWRMLGASLLLFPLALLRPRPALRSAGLSVLAGGFFFAHLWTYIFAVQHTKVANCVVLFAVNPVFTSLGAWALHRARISVRTWLAFAAALGGVYVLMMDRADFSRESVIGDVFAVLSALFFSGYILSGNAARRNVDNLVFAPIVYASAGVLFLVSAEARSIPLTGWPDDSWLGIAGYILVPTLLGHTIYTYLLSRMPMHIMSFGKLLEPVIATAAAWLFFAETPGSGAVFSFAFTAAASALIFWPSPGQNAKIKDEAEEET